MKAFDYTVHAIIKPVTSVMSKMLPFSSGPERRLIDAMCYSALEGGKFWRPKLAYFVCNFYKLPENIATHIGAAVEFMHAGSLIHDDLPCMDDAATRRGQPSCHAEFDEATSVLAGSALYLLAIETLTHPYLIVTDMVRSQLIQCLVQNAGARGMMGGQMHDVLGVARTPEEIVTMHQLKTGALLSFCCVAPGIVAEVDSAEHSFLLALGEKIGILYKLVDDLLDLRPSEVTGKTSERDQDRATYVTVLGEEQTKKQAISLAQHVTEELLLKPYNTKDVSEMVTEILFQADLTL